MLQWLRGYRRTLLPGDLGAGAVVALLLVPQGMAYAVVAGLPPVAGLYASILPPLAYALLGSSMTLSVGPQAITALLVASTLAPLAAVGTPEYLRLAAQLALLCGLALAVCGLLGLGQLANYLSRPVLSGFTNGAVCLIAFDQLGPLIGGTLTAPHTASAATGFGCLLLLLLAHRFLGGALCACGVPLRAAQVLVRLAPALVLLGAGWLLARPRLATLDVALVGTVPGGLPQPGFAPDTAHLLDLAAPALLLAFVVFLQSVSAAQTLARKRHERWRANDELLGLGAANVAASVCGGFPVSGSISRSAVNEASGANTPLAGVVAALLIALALLFPTDWLARLPLPALAATIIAAVFGMFDGSGLRDAWRFDRGEGAAHLVTFTAVLALGAERGIVLGIVLSLLLLIWRASHPPIVEVGRRPGTEYFRNIEREGVERVPAVLMLRIDHGLFFGNAGAVRERIEAELALRPGLKHVVLLLSAVNDIDLTAVEALRELNQTLRERGIALHLTEAKEPVLERLRRTSLPGELGGQMFRRAAQAFDALQDSAA